MFIFEQEEGKKRIASRIAREFVEQSRDRNLFVNLGVGIPTMIADYADSPRIFLQAENGMLGVGPAADEKSRNPLLINAGRIMVTETPGCSFFDSCTSFGMIRGGHIDATVIGAFEVDEMANVANWIIPNGKMLGVGGAMDLVAGARKVYIAMLHTNKNGAPKIIPKCTLPITGHGKVSVVVTEYALFRFREGRMFLEEMSERITLDELKGITPADYVVSDDLKVY